AHGRVGGGGRRLLRGAPRHPPRPGRTAAARGVPPRRPARPPRVGHARGRAPGCSRGSPPPKVRTLADMTVRVDLNISLGGVATTTDQTPENPFGEDWGRLTEAYVATRTFRDRVLHDTSGEGTTGVDDDYARACFAELGAEIMGAGMFGLHAHGDDPGWRGWWGE